MKKIAIFVSGEGSNFKAIYEKIKSGGIHAEISLVVSNNPNCGAITFAEKNASRLIEMDINPLIVRTKGKGVVAADALIHYLEEIK